MFDSMELHRELNRVIGNEDGIDDILERVDNDITVSQEDIIQYAHELGGSWCVKNYLDAMDFIRDTFMENEDE